MNALNLDKLNLVAPYSVWCAEEGVYGFKTDYDIFFRIYFYPDETIWKNGAYEFGIINDSQKASPNDSKVRDTVFHLIENFFENNPDILLYQCETGDNKQSFRDRLFLRWIKSYEDTDRFFVKVSMVVAEEIEHYAALIVQRDNPHFESIVSDFDSFMGFFQNKPNTLPNTK